MDALKSHHNEQKYHISGSVAIKRYLPMILPLCIFIIPLFYRLYPIVNAYSGIISAIFLCLGVIFFLYAFVIPLKTCFRFNYIDLFSSCLLIYALINSILKQPNHLLSNDNILLTVAIILYPAIKLSFQNKAAEIVVLILVLSTGLVVGVLALLQLFRLMPVINFVYKATGVFYNPNVLCTYLSVQFPLILFGLVKSKRLVIKMLCGIYCADALFLNIMLSSRAAFLAMMVVSILLLIKADLHKKYKAPALITASLVLIVSIVISIGIKTGSTEGRLFIWKISAAMFRENPVSGSGFGSYKSRYNLYQAQYFKSADHSRNDILLADENYEPFNDYLGIGIEEGITGLFLFAGLLLAVFFKARKLDGFPFYVSCCILVFAMIGLFSYPVEEPFLFLEFIAFIAICSAYVNGKKLSVNYVIKITALLVAFTCLERFYYTNKWLNIKNKEAGDAREYAVIYTHLKNNPDFLQDYAQVLGNEKNYKYAIKIGRESRDILPTPSIFERLGLFYNDAGIADSAESNLKEAAMIVPGKFVPKYILYNYYKATDNLTKAKKTANDILGMNIKVPSVEVRMIRADVKSFLRHTKNSAIDSTITQ